MAKTIFDFQDYKAYLRAFIKSQPKQGRGVKARIAEAIGCQRGFITKVLDIHSTVDLSLEQAEALNSFLNHSSDETHYFLLLIQYARSGTLRLKEHFRNQMKLALNRRLEAKKELQSRRLLSPEDHMRYYSSWLYAAVRIAVSIPSLQSREALSKKLHVPLRTLNTILEFLIACGFVEKKGDRFLHSSEEQMLISSDHPMVGRHHANWRLQALKSLELQCPQDLHYTYLVSISEADALQIRSFLVESIQEVLKRAAPSKGESIYSFCLDYFEI